MNRQRKELINIAIKHIQDANELLKQALREEEMCFDNLSDGLQQTMRGQQMEENVDILNEVIDSINNAIESLDDIS